MHAGDEFELRLAEIGGDVRVRQRRTERRWMRRMRQGTIKGGPQTFLFKPAAHAAQALGRQFGQGEGGTVHAKDLCNLLFGSDASTAR